MKLKTIVHSKFGSMMLVALVALIILSARTGSKESNAVALPPMLAGKWVPTYPGKIDFGNLPRLSKADHIIVNDVRSFDGHRVNQHNYLVHHGGLYWAMWSEGPGVARAPAGQHRDKVPGHDQAGQRVLYSTSADGLKWTPAKAITAAPRQGYGWIARGFWLREGKLLALVTSFIAPSYSGDGLALHAYELNETNNWSYLGIAAENSMNNFPPALLPNGEWMMTRRDSLKNVHFLYGGIDGYNKWQSVAVASYGGSDFKPEEPYWWVLPDKRILALFRDNGKSGFLFRAVSSDNGRTWSKPEKTNFPDASSKFSGTRLKDGRYVLVSNPNPKKRDPMTIAISNDGIVFDKMIYLVGGRHIDYPHVMEHDGYLFVAFASAKQSVELIRLRISELDKVQMPSTPLSID